MHKCPNRDSRGFSRTELEERGGRVAEEICSSIEMKGQ